MGEENRQPDLTLPADMFRSGIVEEVDIAIYSNGAELRETRRVSKIAGDLILEGDIRVGPYQVRGPDGRGVAPPIGGGARGIGTTGRLWANGKVPYELNGAEEAKVLAAIAHWEDRTPIRFHIKTDADSDFISFEDQGACWSHVGCIGGYQPVSLSRDCPLGSAIHEIGHLLGLWHEQSRSDRDDHVAIVEANIPADQLHNFDKHVIDGRDLGNYDYCSIMHYPPKAFSRNNEDTIVTKPPGLPIGQREGLSSGDLAAIRDLYPDLAWS
jgi:hypothetical protein